MELDIQQIRKIIPHRFPFLMIDRVVDLEPNEKLIAIKNVSVNEPFFTGHFPEEKVMPGVLIVEAMAQAGCVYYNYSKNMQDKNLIYYLAKVNAKFVKPVVPGDQLKIEITTIKMVGMTGILNAVAFVDDKIVAKAEIGCGIKRNLELVRFALKKKPPQSTSFVGYIFQSWSANILIALHVGVYYYLQQALWGKVLYSYLILYPGNLLKGRFWCLLTSGFIHSDGIHLGMNLLGVFIFARIVERHLGVIKTLFIYFGTMILSMLMASMIYSFYFHVNVAIVGASGAVMGLISAAMLLAPFTVTYELILPIPVMVKGWLFLYADIKGFLGAEKDGVSHLAHLCGFLSIALLVYFLSSKDRRMMRTGLVVNLLSFGVFLLIRHWVITGQIRL